VSIGEALAGARREAGLSIADISIRTRIGESVIDDIEHDDYSSCGGEAGARGTIVAIAQALHVDSGPLVDAYDAERGPSEWIAAAKPSKPATVDDELGPQAADDDTEPITTGQSSEPTATDEQPRPVPISEQSRPVPISEQPHPVPISEQPPHVTISEPPPPMTAGEPPPIIPAEASRRVRLTFADRHQSLWLTLGAALLAVALLGSILLIFGGGRAARHATAAGRHRSVGRGATQQAGARPSPGHPAGSPRPTASPSPSSSQPVGALIPSSIAAFGPGGTSQGDSPQLASQALAGKAAAPWHSDWYTTAHFGNLQSGTGLLLDMGRTVTITSARIAMGNNTGADLALRIGNSPTLAGLPPVAHANGAGGVIRLTTAPTRGRYVLVWFTRLPPDQAGTFQVAVYGITLNGYP
jgi:transcriptional regulator with XRE-family HTH domain